MCSISIIVPIYKSEAHLPILIKSIQAQEVSDWELILVDDGSPDQSGELCDAYAKEDHRIKPIHKPNGGISSACNAGLDNATGEWILFCDHDDYLTPNSLSLFSMAIHEPDIDLVAASYIRYHEDTLVEDPFPVESKILSSKVYLEDTCMHPSIRYNEYYLWNKLLKASIIKQNGLRFKEDIHYFQDVLFAYQYLLLCDRFVYCLSKPVYVYFKRSTGESSSITQQYNPKKSPGRLYSHIYIYESFKASPSFASNTVDSFLKNNILQSYFWLQHSILHSNIANWPDIRIYVQATQPYYSRLELLSKWTVRHFRLRLGQLQSKINSGLRRKKRAGNKNNR